MKVQEERWTSRWIWRNKHIYTLTKTKAKKPTNFNKGWTFSNCFTCGKSQHYQRSLLDSDKPWMSNSRSAQSALPQETKKSPLLQPLHILLWNYKEQLHILHHISVQQLQYISDRVWWERLRARHQCPTFLIGDHFQREMEEKKDLSVARNRSNSSHVVFILLTSECKDRSIEKKITRTFNNKDKMTKLTLDVSSAHLCEVNLTGMLMVFVGGWWNFF